MNKEDIQKKYSIHDNRIETYCIYQGCHWTIPAIDKMEATLLDEYTKIVYLNGSFALPYFACKIKRNELGFVEAKFYTKDDAFEALIDRVLHD